MTSYQMYYVVVDKLWVSDSSKLSEFTEVIVVISRKFFQNAVIVLEPDWAWDHLSYAADTATALCFELLKKITFL